MRTPSTWHHCHYPTVQRISGWLAEDHDHTLYPTIIGLLNRETDTVSGNHDHLNSRIQCVVMVFCQPVIQHNNYYYLLPVCLIFSQNYLLMFAWQKSTLNRHNTILLYGGAWDTRNSFLLYYFISKGSVIELLKAITFDLDGSSREILLDGFFFTRIQHFVPTASPIIYPRNNKQ